MDNFHILRLRCYLERIILGTALIVISAGILYGIIFEMITAYLADSKYAYIAGIVSSIILVVWGIILMLQAVKYNQSVFKKYSPEEKQQFYREISADSALSFGNRLTITPHYVMAYARNFFANVYVLKLDDLVACFGREVYGTGEDPESYHLLLFDCSFKKIECIVKGRNVALMNQGYQTLLELSPWVFSENYEEFMDSYTRKSKEKAYLTEIEFRRKEHEPVDDTLPILVTAADIIRKFNEKQNEKDSEHTDQQPFDHS